MYALIDHLPEQYHGICTWDLSQSLSPVQRMARMGGVDMGQGICLGLASSSANSNGEAGLMTH